MTNEGNKPVASPHTMKYSNLIIGTTLSGRRLWGKALHYALFCLLYETVPRNDNVLDHYIYVFFPWRTAIGQHVFLFMFKVGKSLVSGKAV